MLYTKNYILKINQGSHLWGNHTYIFAECPSDVYPMLRVKEFFDGYGGVKVHNHARSDLRIEKEIFRN